MQEAPKASGRACPQVHNSRFPPFTPRSPPNPVPSRRPPHSPDLPAPRRPRIARLTSRGALCGPLPARGFPNTEDMATLRRGPEQRGRPSGPSGASHRLPWHWLPDPVSVCVPGAALSGLRSRGSSRAGGEEGPGEPGGRGRPERRQTPCKGCGSPSRVSLSRLTTQGMVLSGPCTFPCLASRARAASLSGAPPDPAEDKDGREGGPA